MRTSNCKRISRNISPYVAGDLVGESEREVAAHLSACGECRRLAEAFSESRSWLTEAWALPEFSAEFYSGIRSSVLADIGRERMRSKPSFFRPRWLYATAFAAVLIASAAMLQHFSSTRRQVVPSLALAPQVTGQPTLHQAKATDLSSLPQTPGLSGTRGVQVSRFEPAKRQAPSDTGQTARTNRAPIAPAIESPAGVRPVVTESAPVADGSASSPQVARIEIQTANPNIRIIWLQPREPQESDETNRDHDQHQNGTRKQEASCTQ
jgi:anti-sigma factor RsiW